VRLGALLHATLAFIIICAIIVHIYAGIWARGSIRAMVRGTVTTGGRAPPALV
jgi:formate dehydrogenase subunit gamma